MKRKFLFVLLMAPLITLLWVGVYPTSTAAHEPVKLTLYSSKFGTGSYDFASALEKTLEKRGHPWIRVANTESAGGIDSLRLLLSSVFDKTVPIF